MLDDVEASSGITGFNVEERSGNSILLTEVDADFGLPLESTSLPKTATPLESTIGCSQGRLSAPSPKVASSKTSDVSLETSLVTRFSSLKFSVCSRT